MGLERNSMETLEQLRQWLGTFPGWGGEIHIDTLGAQPENAGLYPLGEEVLERREDLLGGVRYRCRQKYRLDRMVSAGEDAAAQLLRFQQWVLEQDKLGLAPRLGDEQRIRAEKGALKEVSQSGTAVYSVVITAEFVREY